LGLSQELLGRQKTLWWFLSKEKGTGLDAKLLILQKVNGDFMQNHEISGEKHQKPLVNVYITNWKDPPCY
jgi:hypothetical protein